MKSNSVFTASSLVLAFLLPTISSGAEIGAGVQAGITHTDNVFLEVSPREIDDIVFAVSPFFKLTHESPTLDAAIDYTFDWYRYSELKETSNFHSGTGSVTGKTWQGTLQAELGGRRSQVLSDPDDVIPSGNLPLSNNLVDQDEWWFNPRLNRELRNDVALQAEARIARVQYDDGRTQDSTNSSGVLSIDNYKVGHGLTWALLYDWQRAEYEVSAPWEYQQAGAELGFWVNAHTRVFGSGGKESSRDVPFDPALEDTFWEAGFAHNAGENLSMEFAAGERSFGSTWRGSLQYTFRRGSTSLSYNEAPTATDFELGGVTRSLLDPGSINDFLDRPGSGEQYVSGVLQWDLNLEFRRTAFSIVFYDEERTDRFDRDATLIDDQSQTSLEMRFSWQAGVRTEFVATGSLLDQETGNQDKSRFKGAGLIANYRLGTRSDLSLGYNYNEQEPRGQGPNNRDYIENVFSLYYTFTM